MVTKSMTGSVFASSFTEEACRGPPLVGQRRVELDPATIHAHRSIRTIEEILFRCWL